MKLGRVVGRVVATRKDPAFEGHKLLLVQPLDGAGEARGRPLIMLDAVRAGAGELIFWVRGREASDPFDPHTPPTDATVAGIVDHHSATDLT